MMALKKSTKYELANLGFAAAFYVAYRYYKSTAQPHASSQTNTRILYGIILYIIVSFIIVVRAYYYKDRLKVTDQSERGSELHAYGLLAKNHLKSTTICLSVSASEHETLAASGSLLVAPERFNMPLRKDDAVGVCTGEGNYQRCINTIVTDIDGVNQLVTLKRPR